MVRVENRRGNNDVVVRAGAGDQIRLHGTITAGTKGDCDFKESKAKVERFQTSPAVVGGENRIEIGAWGDPEMGHCTIMSYELEVPASTSLDIEVKYGGVSVYDVNGPIHARIEAGSIRVKDPGQVVRAETRLGQIMVDGRPEADWLFDIGTGSVDLRLPKDTAFTWVADAHLARLESDFKVCHEESRKSMALRCPVNGGGPSIQIRGRGSVRIWER